MELIKISQSALLKIELPRFAQRVIGIVEEHNPEELQIKEIYDLLVAETPRINNLIDKYGPHPLTEELFNLRGKRAFCISKIRFHLKVVMREDESGVNKDVKTVREAIQHFFKNLELSRNEEMFNQKVIQFINSTNESEELSEALSSLEFVPHIDNLKAIHARIQRVIGAKLTSIAKRPEETTAQLSKAVLTATNNMIKQVEIAPLINPTMDYKPLFRDLNQLFIEYRDMINKRVLFNKRKAEKINNEQNGSIEMTTTTTQSTEPIGMMLHPNVEEISMNGLENDMIEEEKVAAMVSKSVQLPLVDDNGNGDLEK